MSEDLRVTSEERTYLRDLALRYLQYAHLPVMAERTELWYDHNELKGSRPVVVFESGGAQGEMMPTPHCTSPLARGIEFGLQYPITEYEMLGDDKVISPEFRVGWQIHMREFDMDLTEERAEDAEGRNLGFAMHYPVKDLATDLPKLKYSTYHADRAATLANKAAVEEVIGDLMPVVLNNWSICWVGNPSYKVLRLMGMEAMLMAMMDRPDEMKQLYRFVTEDIKRYLLWQEQEGLLTLNNGNHYAGAGSYGFSRELGQRGEGVSPSSSPLSASSLAKSQQHQQKQQQDAGKMPATHADKMSATRVRVGDLWINMNSQETVGISPEMFEEFVYPSYQTLAEMAGLVYFGCCEPVHSIWENCLSKLPHLRKVSVSPWCDEVKIGRWLREANVIYSRKPRPNYIGVGQLDEDAFAEHVAQTVRAARGGHLEIVFRDIYTLCGDLTKPRRAVEIVRRQFDKIW
jgi:hypothetical protein